MSTEKEQNEALNKTDVICCDSFLKIAKHLGWFSLGGHISQRRLCMPYILGTEPMLRVNNCPSCGKEIRNIRIDPRLFK